jgi:uncharacterized membrane protein
MRTPASIAGHPIHPMLVTIPIGLWVFSLACDLIYAFGSGDAVWKSVALYTAIGGIVGAAAAAIPGLVDAVSLPPDIRSTAIKHGVLNVVILGLFVVNVWMRLQSGTSGRFDTPVLLSIVAIALLLVSGWLGGKMVYLGGAGVSAGDARGTRG